MIILQTLDYIILIMSLKNYSTTELKLFPFLVKFCLGKQLA
jgi:hypothetical protein